MEFKVIENRIIGWDSFFDDDFEDVKKLVNEFYKITDNVRNFYTTVFLNKTNRKIGLYYSGGNLVKIRIDVIDLEKD